MTSDLFTTFSKQVKWTKRFECWNGYIEINNHGFSIQGFQGQSLRDARSTLTEKLFTTVQKYCGDKQLDLKQMLAQSKDN